MEYRAQGSEWQYAAGAVDNAALGDYRECCLALGVAPGEIPPLQMEAPHVAFDPAQHASAVLWQRATGVLWARHNTRAYVPGQGWLAASEVLGDAPQAEVLYKL